MKTFRIALANLRNPRSREDSVALAKQAVGEAGATGAGIVCFPECYIPGYRVPGKGVLPPDVKFLERAWAEVRAAAARAGVTVILGTERVPGHSLPPLAGSDPSAPADSASSNPIPTALVINADGTVAGFQDKVQIDPSEESIYTPGIGRRIFQAGPLTFGIVICHEGWRYPETARWAARRGAHIVFHPAFHEAEPGGFRPTTFADPANTFHEKAVLCRAAENTCYFATVNCASAGSPTTSAVVRPDGTLQCFQPYGKEGLLVADIDLSTATGLLAKRLRASAE